mmetsp:Transcript_41043/g.121709  ORF Transcript_41043/g.121709 Transcript_41043/m.121709 type:complete len:149 (+) Transcript_41043:342-788(+)
MSIKLTASLCGSSAFSDLDMGDSPLRNLDQRHATETDEPSDSRLRPIDGTLVDLQELCGWVEDMMVASQGSISKVRVGNGTQGSIETESCLAAPDMDRSRPAHLLSRWCTSHGWLRASDALGRHVGSTVRSIEMKSWASGERRRNFRE